MTKDQLQKELKEKVKAGVKPSDLKKLKRSKSAGDIPLAPSLPSSVPVSRSKSNQTFNDPKYPFTTLISQQEELEALKKETKAKSTTIALLRKKNEELEQSVSSFQEHEKVLQKTLSQVSPDPQLNSELDNALFARHQNLKDWFTQYQKTKQLDQELSENIDQASTELITQDQKISQLQSENRKLKQTNQSLQKDLTLTQRLAESRKTPLPNSDPVPTLNYLKYTLYAGSALWLVIILMKTYQSKAQTPRFNLNQELQ